jgi:lysophospholipase L1-like esterase
MRSVGPFVRATSLAFLLSAACAPAKDAFPPASSFCVAGYGDSLTLGRTPAESYLTHLPADWGPTNRGNSGEFGIGGQARLRAAIPDLIAHGVDVVVMMWGTNDVYSPLYEDQGTSWRDELVAETAASLDQLAAAGITPILVVPPPLFEASEQGRLADVRIADLEPLLAAEASARGVAFVDLFAAFLAEPDPSPYFEADGVHLTADGAAFVASQIEPAVTPIYDGWLSTQAP